MKYIHRFFQVEKLSPKISILGMVLLFLLFAMGSLNAQNQSPAVLKQQMAKIRQSTNWEDPVAAKKANDQIRELSKKLMMTGKPQGELPKGLSNEETEQFKQEAVDDKMKLWGQMMTIAREGGAWDLAKPLCDEIVQEYKDDEDPTIKNAEWLNSMSYLLINLSLPQVQVIIDQMPMFKGIKTLIITTEKPVANVNLAQILKNAENYALEDLYIINFGPALTSIPPAVGSFSNLKILAIYNNGLTALPVSVSKLTRLTSLQIQGNPISSLLPAASALKSLKELGVQKTKLTEAEVIQLQKILPECKISRQ